MTVSFNNFHSYIFKEQCHNDDSIKTTCSQNEKCDMTYNTGTGMRSVQVVSRLQTDLCQNKKQMINQKTFNQNKMNKADRKA